jgi:transposase-like protein
MTLLDLLNKSEQGADPNFLRDGVQLLAQELMDAEVADLVGAEPHRRTDGGVNRQAARSGLLQHRPGVCG